MKSSIAKLTAVLVSCGASSVSHAEFMTLLDSNLMMRVIFQATSNSQVFVTSFPASAVVSETDVEFPNVSSLFDRSSGVPPNFVSNLVNVAIDVGPDYVEIDFGEIGSHRVFAPGFQNTYVLTFMDRVDPIIAFAEIDADRTTLGLTSDDVTVSGNELFINVEGLPFDRSTFVRIDMTVIEGPTD